MSSEWPTITITASMNAAFDALEHPIIHPRRLPRLPSVRKVKAKRKYKGSNAAKRASKKHCS